MRDTGSATAQAIGMGTSEVKEEKHSVILGAIDRLGHAVNDLEHTVSKIAGEQRPEVQDKAEVGPPVPPLSVFLSEAHESILHQTNRIQTSNAQLKELLF